MNKYQINIPGKYKYKMPHWENWVSVEVVESKNKKRFSFQMNFFPVLFDDIPEEAIFEEV